MNKDQTMTNQPSVNHSKELETVSPANLDGVVGGSQEETVNVLTNTIKTQDDASRPIVRTNK